MTRRLGTHPFVADQTVPADHNGRAYCTCGAPRDHERHDLPDNPAAAEEARRLGESED